MILQISIHAPVKGATVLVKFNVDTIFDFNPRTREGCDGGDGQVKGFCDISIHAPVKGATSLGQ